MFNGRVNCKPRSGLDEISDVSKNGAIDNESNPKVNPLKVAAIIVIAIKKACNLFVWKTISRMNMHMY